MNNTKEKTAIILAGGGMRSAHGAGFLYALAKNFGITTPDIMIGSSGGAGTVLYFASGQYESLMKIWCNLVSTSKFISFMRPWRIMDVDYLIDFVFKKQEPLDVATLRKTKILWNIAVTNYDTGTVRYINMTDNVDPFEIMRATKAIPVFYGKRITLLNGRYFDGELGPTLEDHVAYAIKQGAQRILLISDAPSLQSTWLRQLIMRLYASTTSVPLRKSLLHDILSEKTCLTLPKATLVCVMPRNLPAGVITRDKEKLRHTFERGVADALAMETELRTLFNTTS